MKMHHGFAAFGLAFLLTAPVWAADPPDFNPPQVCLSALRHLQTGSAIQWDDVASGRARPEHIRELKMAAGLFEAAREALTHPDDEETKKRRPNPLRTLVYQGPNRKHFVTGPEESSAAYELPSNSKFQTVRNLDRAKSLLEKAATKRDSGVVAFNLVGPSVSRWLDSMKPAVDKSLVNELDRKPTGLYGGFRRVFRAGYFPVTSLLALGVHFQPRPPNHDSNFLSYSMAGLTATILAAAVADFYYTPHYTIPTSTPSAMPLHLNEIRKHLSQKDPKDTVMNLGSIEMGDHTEFHLLYQHRDGVPSVSGVFWAKDPKVMTAVAQLAQKPEAKMHLEPEHVPEIHPATLMGLYTRRREADRRKRQEVYRKIGEFVSKFKASLQPKPKPIAAPAALAQAPQVTEAAATPPSSPEAPIDVRGLEEVDIDALLGPPR